MNCLPPVLWCRKKHRTNGVNDYLLPQCKNTAWFNLEGSVVTKTYPKYSKKQHSFVVAPALVVCLLLLICHQSLEILHFLPFKIKFLLTKLISWAFFSLKKPIMSFDDRRFFGSSLGLSYPFLAFVWPKCSSEFKRNSSAYEGSSSSFCFFAAFSSFKIFSLSSNNASKTFIQFALFLYLYTRRTFFLISISFKLFHQEI